VDYLCNANTHIRTLFATHYHELTVLEDEVEGVRNLNVDVAEENGNIVFLHKIIPGSASQSYGVHVAKLAGVPQTLLENAENKLIQLEQGSVEIKSAPMTIESAPAPKVEEEQISFFMPGTHPAVERLKALDLMEVTPSQAIRILEELKEIIND
ncbi:MAG: DNA mismatch repair protein MutS, partial [Firmicutes bacterium]|nr:DNA mismatch repair protein MutS [Bacillota bacterium]